MQKDEGSTSAEGAARAEPMLLRLRSGKTAAIVIAAGFGGGTMLLGVASTAASAMRGGALLGAILGYGIAVLPLLALAGIIAVCKSELWLVPESKSFRMLTYRPWRLAPRVEEAPISEYAGVRTAKMKDDDDGSTLVSLVTSSGEDVPLRQFSEEAEALEYASKLGEAAGLWVRAAEETAAQPG